MRRLKRPYTSVYYDYISAYPAWTLLQAAAIVNGRQYARILWRRLQLRKRMAKP